VQDGNGTTIDFWVYVQPSDSTLWLVPLFVGDSTPPYQSSLSRNDFSLALERLSGNGLAFVSQALEPGHPLLRDFLHLVRRQTFPQVGAAK